MPEWATYTGDGAIAIDADRAWVQLDTAAATDAPAGIVTLAYAAPVAPAAARGYIAFEYPDQASWIVDSASFLVRETCTITREVVVPDAEPLPVAEDVPELAESGAEAGPAIALAAGLLAAGLVVLILGRGRTVGRSVR